MEEQAAAEAQEQHHADPGHRHPRIDTSIALHINDGRVNHRWALRALADRVARGSVVVVAMLPGCIVAAFVTRLVVPSLGANKALKRAEARAGAAVVTHFDQGRALAARLASVPDPLVRSGSTARRRRRGRR